MSRLFCILILLLLGWSYSQVSSEVLEGLGPKYQQLALQLLTQAEAQGLPLYPLQLKIQEGLAKGRSGEQIIGALKMRLSNMETVKTQNTQQSPADFSKALFNLEKGKAPQVKKAIKKRAPVKNPEPPPQEQVNPPVSKKQEKSIEKAEEKIDEIMDKASNQEDKPGQSLEEKTDKIEKVLEKKEEKQEKKLEKKQEILEKKLEKRMDILEKKLLKEKSKK